MEDDHTPKVFLCRSANGPHTTTTNSLIPPHTPSPPMSYLTTTSISQPPPHHHRIATAPPYLPPLPLPLPPALLFHLLLNPRLLLLPHPPLHHPPTPNPNRRPRHHPRPKPYKNLSSTSNKSPFNTSTSPPPLSLSSRTPPLHRQNDNTVGIQYGTSTLNIMYLGIPLGRGSVPGFFQPAHSVRQVQTIVIVDRVNLMETDAADLVKDATVNDRVELQIIGDVSAEIRILGLTSPSIEASVDCGIAISPTKQGLVYKQRGFDGLQV